MAIGLTVFILTYWNKSESTYDSGRQFFRLCLYMRGCSVTSPGKHVSLLDLTSTRSIYNRRICDSFSGNRLDDNVTTSGLRRIKCSRFSERCCADCQIYNQVRKYEKQIKSITTFSTDITIGMDSDGNPVARDTLYYEDKFQNEGEPISDINDVIGPANGSDVWGSVTTTQSSRPKEPVKEGLENGTYVMSDVFKTNIVLSVSTFSGILVSYLIIIFCTHRKAFFITSNIYVRFLAGTVILIILCSCGGLGIYILIILLGNLKDFERCQQYLILIVSWLWVIWLHFLKLLSYMVLKNTENYKIASSYRRFIYTNEPVEQQEQQELDYICPENDHENDVDELLDVELRETTGGDDYVSMRCGRKQHVKEYRRRHHHCRQCNHDKKRVRNNTSSLYHPLYKETYYAIKRRYRENSRSIRALRWCRDVWMSVLAYVAGTTMLWWIAVGIYLTGVHYQTWKL